MPVSEDFRSGCTNSFNFKQRYKNLKRKFRYLIYENECFQEELKKAHQRLLKVNQDKSFLLDRLLQYEKVDDTSSDSDGTISSDSDMDNLTIKKKKTSTSSMVSNSHNFSSTQSQPNPSRHPTVESGTTKRKKPASKSTKAITNSNANSNSIETSVSSTITIPNASVNNNAVLTQHPLNIKIEPEEDSSLVPQGDGHMTSEEIERHLESRRTLLDLVPERAPPTVPTEMFANFLADD